VVGLLLVLYPLVAISGSRDSSYGQSNYFSLNTNSIGFGDSGLLHLSASPSGELLPRRTTLGDPTPNPFNPAVMLPYSVGKAGRVEISVFDIRGRKIRGLVRSVHERGAFHTTWDGCDQRGSAMPAGVYFVRIKGGITVISKKVTLLK
jgi:hypothetical protein